MFDSVPDFAAKRAELTPNKLAFRDQGTQKEWTFSQVNAAADGIADGMVELGLSEGDRVAILCLNQTEFFLTLFACQKTGIILCPLNWRQPLNEMSETLGPFDAKTIIYGASHSELALSLANEIDAKAIAIDGQLTDWITKGGQSRSAPVPAERPWYLLFTSGTTGNPKAVIQTARMSWANAVNIGQAVSLSEADRSVNFLPLFHTAGINLYTLPLFLNGGSSTILSHFKPGDIFQLIRDGEVTQFFGVPAIYQAFSLMDDIDEINWAGIRCGCGGAPLSEPLIKFFAERGANVLNGFGMTETGPTVFLMDEANARDKIGSVGKAQMLTDVRLDGVPAGETGRGEIQLRGPGITPGYFENPEATQNTFTDDGWLATGDVGYRDEDGYYFVVDRIKDMFISGGENVYPAEVEKVLNSHPAILESAVIGVPDEKWGEVGAAFILLRPGETLDTCKIRPWCREKLAAYKVPARIQIVEEFPRTASGKIRKPDLREELADA